MSRKRGVPEEDNDDDHDSDENMEDDIDDHKGDANKEDGVVDIEHSGDLQFLDTFYGLASSSPAERAQSAHALLNHCLLGPSANSSDAAYAFRRLMNGLCSGRAAARQGYASTLTSFLKIASKTGALKQLQEEDIDSNDESVLNFVRKQLIKATDPNEISGKKKGSEERDHHFGRLFGILSVVRSGVLLPKDGQTNVDELNDVAAAFAQDLVQLYNHRKWMREPTAFAIINLLDSYFDLCPQPEAADIVKNLVFEVVVPELLSGTEIVEYTAEQIAIAVNIHCQTQQHGMALPAGHTTVVLSKENVPMLAKALSATSAVSQPRMHAVWDVIWCLYLTVPENPNVKPQKGKSVTRILRKTLPGCSDSAQDIVEALIEYVVIESLLGVDSESGCPAGHNATHERRALAMALIKVLCGSDSMSNKAGPFRLLVDGSLLQQVILTPVIVRKLFIDVICAGVGKQSSHMLKPMALHVLDSIVVGGELAPDDLDRRLSCAKALLACEPRFDGRTKSAACMNLLFLDGLAIDEVTPVLVNMWKAYVDFLQERVLAAAQLRDERERSSWYEALGYIDLLFIAAKRLNRLNSVEEQEETNIDLTGQILAFFFVGAFFNCSKLKGGGKDMFSITARKIQRSSISSFSYEVRIMMSARFYSLLADFAVVLLPSKSSSQEIPSKQNKDLRMFQMLGEFNQGWTRLEGMGCMTLRKTPDESSNSDMIPNEAISEIVTRQHNVAIADNNSTGDCVQRFRIGCASMSSALHLHLLTCGEPESLDAQDDMDLDEEDENELSIKEFISALASAQHNLMCELGFASNTVDADVDNALGEFAEVCVGVLSSPFGVSNQSRGASPKLLRETVRAAWAGALQLCGQEKPEPSPFDKSLVDLLMSSIGEKQQKDSDDGDEDDDDDDGSDMNSEGDENDNTVFTAATAAGVDFDDDDEKSEGGDDDEVLLDASQLQDVLLKESDDDDEEMVLEHHAGADKALAKLIRLRQEARKAGQQALERIELSNQLRCTLLVDILLSNPGRQLDSLFTPEFVQGMILKMLTLRRQLEKSLMSATKAGKKASASDSEKRAMVEKLTALMKTKLFKLKSLPVLDGAEFSKLLLGIIKETQNAGSEGQLSCCSAALIVVCKMATTAETWATLTAAYADLVNEWATKRTTRLKSTIFSDLVQHQTRYVH